MSWSINIGTFTLNKYSSVDFKFGYYNLNYYPLEMLIIFIDNERPFLRDTTFNL